jgi:hypothetical protein
MKLILPPKLLEKLLWVPVILFRKISFPVKHLMPYYDETDPNRLTLWITLMATRTSKSPPSKSLQSQGDAKQSKFSSQFDSHIWAPIKALPLLSFLHQILLSESLPHTHFTGTSVCLSVCFSLFSSL